VEVSDHIKKAAGAVSLFGEVRSIQILGIPHTALKAYAGENKEYVISVIRGVWSWSSCSCSGYMYTNLCKHIYKANLYLDKKEEEKKQ